MTRTRSSNNDARAGHRDTQSGFSLLEAVIAISVLSVGLLGVAAAIGYSVTTNNRSRNVTAAKQMVTATFQEVKSMNESRRLTFGQIGNASSGGFTGFVAVFEPVTSNAGADGIIGTDDDVVVDDDTENDGFYRKIEISEVNPNLKKVTVTIKYSAGHGEQELTGVGYVNNLARANFRS